MANQVKYGSLSRINKQQQQQLQPATDPATNITAILEQESKRGWQVLTPVPAATPVIKNENDVNNVTFAAFLRPAGKFRPIFSNFSRNDFPPFFDFALLKFQTMSSN